MTPHASWRQPSAEHPRDFDEFRRLLTEEVPFDLKGRGVSELPIPVRLVETIDEPGIDFVSKSFGWDTRERVSRQGTYHVLLMDYFNVNDGLTKLGMAEAGEQIYRDLVALSKEGIPCAPICFLAARAWLMKMQHPIIHEELKREHDRLKDQLRKAKTWARKVQRTLGELFADSEPLSYEYDAWLRRMVQMRLVNLDLDRPVDLAAQVIAEELEEVQVRYENWRLGALGSMPNRKTANPREVQQAAEGIANWIREHSTATNTLSRARRTMDFWGIPINAETERKVRQRRQKWDEPKN